MAELLLRSGADAAALDTSNRTPLYCAAVNDDADTTTVLLRGGADCRSDIEAFRYALKYEKEAVIDAYLLGGELDAGMMDEPLCKARVAHLFSLSPETLREKPKERLKGLIEVRDAEGDSALHRAARAKAHARLALLLELGADWNSKDSRGRTALQTAVANRDFVSTERLLEVGAGLGSEERMTLLASAAHREQWGQVLAGAMEDDVWAAVEKRDAELLRFYTKKYANGRHAPRALDLAAFLEAESKGTQPAYEAYLREHPSGTHAETARKQIERLAIVIAEPEIERIQHAARLVAWLTVQAVLQRGYGQGYSGKTRVLIDDEHRLAVAFQPTRGALTQNQRLEGAPSTGFGSLVIGSLKSADVVHEGKSARVTGTVRSQDLWTQIITHRFERAAGEIATRGGDDTVVVAVPITDPVIVFATGSALFEGEVVVDGVPISFLSGGLVQSQLEGTPPLIDGSRVAVGGLELAWQGGGWHVRAARAGVFASRRE